jgi:signal transduction histidine kinase
MYDAAGKLIGVLGVGRDITQRKQAEKAILRLNRELEQRVIERTAELTAANEELKTFARVMQAAKVEAERANAAKSHFLSSASHDLRQPLQALRLFIDMLSADLQGSQFQKKIDLAAKVLTSAETILHSLFDVARIQSGAFIPEPTEIGIVDLFGKFATEFTSLAQAKDLVFRTRPLPLSVQSDPLMLERIMRNLLANAVRYTERGGILLACRRRKQSVVIEVRDTGPGIAPEHHQAIWDEFYQIGNFGRDSSLGLGLGLSIVAKLAERLGHRVELYSRPSIGTAFRIVIPTTDQS